MDTQHRLMMSGGATGRSLSGPPVAFAGREFIDAQGRPWLFAAYISHLMPVRIYNGEDMGPRLDEALSYGANAIETIGMHDSSWKHTNGYALNPLADPPRYQQMLATLFDLAAARGLMVAHAVFADCQYKPFSVDEQRRIWSMSKEVMRGRWNVLPRIGNEWPVNGYYPGDFDRDGLDGMLCSRGSTGIDGTPYPDQWDWSEWSPPRCDNEQVWTTEPWAKSIGDHGAGTEWLYTGYKGEDGTSIGPYKRIVNTEPLFFNDTPRDRWGDSRCCDPTVALRIGLNAAANCSGAGFGASDGLEALPLGSVAAECARLFYRGLWAAFVR
jgi:hypothetical protein